VPAADKGDRFAALGAGIASCSRFLEARNSQSKEYFLFGGWIDGYLSAHNQLEAGHYKGATERNFDEATVAAIRKFQAAQSIDVSGFPDQRTLFALFHRQ